MLRGLASLAQERRRGLPHPLSCHFLVVRKVQPGLPGDSQLRQSLAGALQQPPAPRGAPAPPSPRSAGAPWDIPAQAAPSPWGPFWKDLQRTWPFLSRRQEGICSPNQFSQPHGWKEFAVSLNSDPLVSYMGPLSEGPSCQITVENQMPRPRRLVGLITLNKTQPAEGGGGAGRARARHPAPWRYEGHGCDWARCPLPSGLGLGPPIIPGEPARPALETGDLQCGTARQAQGCQRPQGLLEIPETLGAVGSHSVHGDTETQTDGQCPIELWGWLWTGCRPWPYLWPIVSSRRPRAHSSGHRFYLWRLRAIQASSPGLLGGLVFPKSLRVPALCRVLREQWGTEANLIPGLKPYGKGHLHLPGKRAWCHGNGLEGPRPSPGHRDQGCDAELRTES